MKKLLDQIRKELEYNRMRHIQVLLRYNNRKPCVKFNFVDTEDYKNRLKLICSKKYADKLVLIKETSTTLLYEIKEDHHEIMA